MAAGRKIAGGKQVGAGGIALAIAVVVALVGFLWWHYFGGPVGQGPAANPSGASPSPGNPRAYPGGMPPGLQPGAPVPGRGPG